MKANINNIRENACQLLSFYRSMYNACHNNLITVNNDVIDNMYNHYLMIRGLYNCELISTDTINRSYYMYSTIKFMKRGDN